MKDKNPNNGEQNDPATERLRMLINAKIAAHRKGGQPPLNLRSNRVNYADIPDGKYPTIVDAKSGFTKWGTPCVQTRHTISDGEYAGVTLRKDLYTTEDALLYSLDMLIELGLDSYDAMNNAVINGVKCITEIGTEESFSGKKRKVVESFAVTDATSSPVSSACPPPDVPAEPTGSLADGNDEEEEEEDFLI